MNLSAKREGKQSLRGAVLYTKTPMLSRPLRRGFVLCQAGTMLTFYCKRWAGSQPTLLTALLVSRESWKELPSPELLDGQLKPWESILALLKPVAKCLQTSAKASSTVRRGRAMNCNNTAQRLCSFWWKRVRNQSRVYSKQPKCLLPCGDVQVNARPWYWVMHRAWAHPCF